MELLVAEVLVAEVQDLGLELDVEDLVLVHQLVVQHHQHHTNQLLVQQLLVQQHNRCVQHAEVEALHQDLAETSRPWHQVLLRGC